jgi:hypothetical protein
VLIFLFSLFITAHAADLPDFAVRRCAEARGNTNCSIGHDITARCDMNSVYCYEYTGCSGDTSNVLVAVNNMPPVGKQAAYKSCTIYTDQKSGKTHREIATSLGTALIVDADVDGSLTTKVTTADGELICTQKVFTGTYDECRKKMSDHTDYEKVSVVGDTLMNQLLFNKTRLSQVGTAPVPAPRLNRSEPVAQ